MSYVFLGEEQKEGDKNVTKQIPQQSDTQQTPQTCHNKGYISKIQKQLPRTEINFCIPARWIYRTAFWWMSFDFLEEVVVSLPLAPVLALVKAMSGRFILMLSIFFSRNHSVPISFFDLNQMRTREEADPEAPQTLLCGKPPGLKVLTNCSSFLLNWGSKQVWLRSMVRHGESSRAPGRHLMQDDPHFSSHLLLQELSYVGFSPTVPAHAQNLLKKCH